MELTCSFGLGLCDGLLDSTGRCARCRQKSKGQSASDRDNRDALRLRRFKEAKHLRSKLSGPLRPLLSFVQAAQLWEVT